MNKRGDTVIYETVIFVVLNVAFFAVMLLFIWRAASDSVVYEQAYSKEVALMISNAKPGLTYFFDMRVPIAMVKDNKWMKSSLSDKEILNKLITIKSEDNLVIATFTTNGGHSFRYFTDYDVKVTPTGDSGLSIDVTRKAITTTAVTATGEVKK
jgi:hypothetical protein